MQINSTHPQYNAQAENWRKIEDITRLKNLGQYLLELNPSDTSDDNKLRNAQYKKRAIFYAIAAQTVSGMIGTIFRKWPKLTVPDELLYLSTNADGGGQSIYQSSQGACDDVLRKGRAGIYVTFPRTDGEVKREDILAGRYVATIARFAPEQIINWRIQQDGSRSILVLVVTKETEDVVSGKGYAAREIATIYREMFLDFERNDNGEPISARRVFHERIWRESDSGGLQQGPLYIPRDAAGQPWDEIPFAFVGSENNDTVPDSPPMLPLVELNIGHYRNSADYEDSVWFCGQAQPWMSGLTQDFVDMMKTNRMYVGSRNLIGVPAGESFGFAQAAPNTMVREAMQDKITAMIQMGARLLQSGSQTKTATQAEADKESQTSVLAMVASNVSEAYTQALKWVCRYMGADDSDVEYTLSQDFVTPSASPQMLQQMVAGFLSGAVTPAAMLEWQKKNELEDKEKPLDQWLAEINRESSV